jgi:predicted transposase/invertase (TIGR01784 family)
LAKVRFAFFEEGSFAFGAFFGHVIEHRGVACEFLDTRLTVAVGIKGRLEAANGDRSYLQALYFTLIQQSSPPLMSFDNTCRRLAELFPEDFASWLLGRRITLTELTPTELSIEPIRADSLILLQGDSEIIHIEFQTRPDKNMPTRLADYRIRLHRKFPGKTIHQIVIYLKKTRSKKVFETTFDIAGIRGEFTVIRIWEVPAEELLSYPGLLPFAPLGKSKNALSTLRSAVQVMNQLPDRSQQHETLAAAYILSGLQLDQAMISQIIRRDIMKESVTYQAILTEGKQEGIALGEQRGTLNSRLEIANRMLMRGMAIEDIIDLTDLTREQIQAIRKELRM